ncbi:MAG: hypothetical protein KKG75_00675 [Nanoarchaeota archaeon]|nr:hypothetical protein [Nanoarchaeota archaeon]
MDHKIKVIVGLSFVVLVLFAYIGANAYANQKQVIYRQGVQDGALLQQQDIVRTVATTGYVAFNVVGQDGQPVNLILAPVQQQQQATQ